MKKNCWSFSLKLFMLSVVMFATVAQLFAQVNLTARSSHTRVGVRQQFSVTYSLTGGRSEAFERPPFEGFRMMGQSSTTGGGSFQMIVNGQVVNSSDGDQSWTFTLMPTTTGNFDIPPAKAKVDGQWYSSPSLKVQVVQGHQQASPAQSQTQSQTRPQQQQQSQTDRQNSSNTGELNADDVVITATADKTSAWVGEPIIITYRIYTRVTIPSYAINKIPAFDGFWSENLEDPNSRPQQSEATLNGKRYTSALLRKIVVYPQRSGNLTVDPLEVELIARIVRQQKQQGNVLDWMDQMFQNFFSDPFGNDPFSSFPSFGSSYEDIQTVVKSNTLRINVKDLPLKNRNADFTGQVGQYNMEAWVDKNKMLLDDALTLSVKISGNGNLSLLEPPAIIFPKSFDVFDPQVDEQINTSGSGISGSKTFTYLIMPREPGNFSIQPFLFSWFDPKTGDYKTIESDEFEIQVVGQHSGGQSTVETEQDIRFIQLKAGRFKSINSFFFSSALHFVLFFIPLLLFVLFVILLRRRIQLYSNQDLLRYKRAVKMAKRRLKKASVLLKHQQLNEFYEETARAIWAYLAHRFSIQQSELSVDKVIDQLAQSEVDEDVLASLRSTLDFCEYIRFAPGASSTTPGDILQKAEDTIRNLEQHILFQKRKIRKS